MICIVFIFVVKQMKMLRKINLVVFDFYDFFIYNKGELGYVINFVFKNVFISYSRILYNFY